jgi:hypothetical protein
VFIMIFDMNMQVNFSSIFFKLITDFSDIVCQLCSLYEFVFFLLEWLLGWNDESIRCVKSPYKLNF